MDRKRGCSKICDLTGWALVNARSKKRREAAVLDLVPVPAGKVAVIWVRRRQSEIRGRGAVRQVRFSGYDFGAITPL